MSICFTICPSVLLVFKYRSSRHDGATHIVTMFHAPLCTRLILPFRHLHFFYLLAAAALLHIYDHLFFFGARMCAFYLVLLCSLLFVFYLPLDHGTYKHKPT